MKAKNQIYVYLAKRDKSSVRVIGEFDYATKVYPTKLDQQAIASLNMNPQAASVVSKEAWNNRMDYELYMESASSFEELKSSLRARGYSHLPNHQISTGLNPGKMNENALVLERSTMMRRWSTVR